MAKRDSYADVGASLRVVIERAATRSLRAREYRVLLGILHYTVSYSKLTDEIAIDGLVDVTGLDRRNVRRALAELHDRGLVVYQPGASEPGKPRRRSVVTLPSASNDRGSTEPRTGGPLSPPSEKSPRNPPEARVPARTPAPARTRESAPHDEPTTDDGEGTSIDNFLDPIPSHVTRHITPGQRHHLAATVDQACATGWRPRQLARAVLDLDAKRGPLDQLESMGAVAVTLERRIGAVGDPPRQRQPRQHCDTCNGPGLIVDLDNVARPCPDCRPDGLPDTDPRINRPTPDPIDALLGGNADA